MASEIEIQHDIMKEFGARPYLRIWRQNVGMGYSYQQVKRLITLVTCLQLQQGMNYARTLRPVSYGQPGMPDLGGILSDGRMLGIEVKSATGRQSAEQKAYQGMMEKFGGLYILARSVQDVELALAKAGYTK